MERDVDIPASRRYAFPEALAVVPYRGRWLAVAIETGCWIVLDNSGQREFFELLRGHSLGEALGLFGGAEADAEWVVTQLEARQFVSPERKPFREEVCNISLTTRCNLRCPHCYLSAGEAQLDELSTAELTALLDNVAGVGIGAVTFSGGEVCLRPDLPELASHAKRLGLDVQLLSNGSLWTEALVEAMAPNISGVQISIDGYDAAEDARLRGAGHFDKALAAVDEFVRRGLSVRVAITPWPEAALAGKMQRYADFARRLRLRYEGRDLKVLFTSSILDGRELLLTDEERERYRQTMVATLECYLGPAATDNPFILTHLERRVMENCSYGCLHVSSNGDVTMCAMEGCQPVANVRRDDFERIIELSRAAQEATSVGNLMPCRECELKYICGGGCRIQEFEALRHAPAAFQGTPTRKCDSTVKEKFYDLMVRTNEAIFS